MDIEKDLNQILLAVVLFAAVGFGGYKYNQLYQDMASTTAQFQRSVKTVQSLQADLAQAKSENAGLTDSLQSEKNRNDSFAGQIDDIAGTVGVLQKIKNTDPQLLEKYSKIYFLNENYVPAKLANIPKQYLFDTKKPQLFQGDVLSHLEDMFDAAEKAGDDLRVSSAFRSFDTQASLKTGYAVTYGTGANQFSADQGYSEHQLGTAVDIILPTLTALTTDFEKTKAYEWLTTNAYKYGFILSYPEGNAYYQFEPWHWRFVGIRLAKYIHSQDKHFYDLDQRKIDEYRAEFFD